MAIVEPALGDLTARARIRDAALRLFAQDGIDATTIRGIARAAGVSGGLVRHHFGSKDDLRRACDAHVLAQLMAIKARTLSGEHESAIGFLTSTQPAMLVMLRYFARSLLDGSDAADAMLAEVLELSREWIERHDTGEIADPSAEAALLVATELGVLVMREQLSHALGDDILGQRGHLRLARAKVDFYSKPLLSPEVAARARAALDELQRHLPPRPSARKAR